MNRIKLMAHFEQLVNLTVLNLSNNNVRLCGYLDRQDRRVGEEQELEGIDIK